MKKLTKRQLNIFKFIRKNKNSGNKEIKDNNSNFFRLYHRKIIKGIPITGWINSKNNGE